MATSTQIGWFILICYLGTPLLDFRSDYSGRVIDTNKNVISDATVTIKGTGISTKTNLNGEYKISSTVSDARIAAWAPGYYISGTNLKRGVYQSILLKPIPDDNPHYQFIDAAMEPDDKIRCQACHQEIVSDWATHGHARGMQNESVQAYLEFYREDFPIQSANCKKCHAPATAESVSCDFCHKINALKSHTGHGIDGFHMRRPPAGKQTILGPLADVDRGHDSRSELFGKAEFCAPCHGAKMYGQPVYDSFLQWQSSPARTNGVICQDCHMPSPLQSEMIASSSDAIMRPSWQIHSHTDPVKDIEFRRQYFAVDPKIVTTQNGLEVQVIIRNKNTAHSFPTGSPLRRVRLEVEVQAGDQSSLKFFDLVKNLRSRNLSYNRNEQSKRRFRSHDEFFWWPFRIESDTRIPADSAKHLVFDFNHKDWDSVAISLIYQPYPAELAARLNDDSSLILYKKVFKR